MVISPLKGEDFTRLNEFLSVMDSLVPLLTSLSFPAFVIPGKASVAEGAGAFPAQLECSRVCVRGSTGK